MVFKNLGNYDILKTNTMRKLLTEEFQNNSKVHSPHFMFPCQTLSLSEVLP